MGMKKEQDHMMVIYDEKRESQTEKIVRKRMILTIPLLDFIIIFLTELLIHVLRSYVGNELEMSVGNVKNMIKKY